MEPQIAAVVIDKKLPRPLAGMCVIITYTYISSHIIHRYVNNLLYYILYDTYII